MSGRPRVFDFLAVLLVAPAVELCRRAVSLHRATAFARKLSRRRCRTAEERARLRRAIRFVDARFPDGGNCFRRSLLEIILDRGAAGELLYAGLKSGGGRNSGHVWLASHPVPAESYDALVTV